MKPRPLDSLLAIKVLAVHPGLKPSDRAVASIIIDHFNRHNGRCDPGLERIAGLAGLSQRTVIRAINRLIAAGLFHKDRHGGTFNKNAYGPNWSRFAELEAAWRGKFKRAGNSPLSTVSPSSRQPCHVSPDTGVTQTCSSNLLKETCSKGPPKDRIAEALTGASKQLFPSRSEHAARSAAERRWMSQLDLQFRSHPTTYAEVIDALTPEMQEAATEAEMRWRGSGLPYIADRLRLGPVVPTEQGCADHD